MNIILALLVLSFIVVIHELGHFLLAKKNGITVTEFSVGMGPRLASFVRNGTRYSLKLLPIGGSCMMLGEDDTVEDEGAFNKKSPWARFSVLVAGAVFNFILAFVLALIVLGTKGIDIPNVIGIDQNTPAKDSGIQAGDRITHINGKKVNLGREIYAYLYFNPLSDEAMDITYLRDGESYSTSVQPVIVNTYLMGCTFSSTASEPLIEKIEPGFPMELAGLQVGDVVSAINGVDIGTRVEFYEYLESNPLTNKEITLSYDRGDEVYTTTLTPKLAQSNYSLGIEYQLWADKIPAVDVLKYSFYEVKYNIVNTIETIGYLLTGKVSFKEMAGPVGIVNYVDQIVTETKSYGITTTLLSLASFSILLSANLGVMNLLPLPALDGGRIIFVLIEAIRKKPVAQEKEAIVHFVGMAALMLLMVFVLFNDISKLFG